MSARSSFLPINKAEEDIAREIDQLVAEQVAICLKDHIPQELQDEVAEQQRILEEVRRDLHNSWVPVKPYTSTS
jgi:archaellum component FlaC